MKRTTIVVPDEVDARMRYLARRRGVTLSTVLREAIETYVPVDDSELGLFAIGESGDSDVSENIDSYLRESLEADRVKSGTD